MNAMKVSMNAQKHQIVLMKSVIIVVNVNLDMMVMSARKGFQVVRSEAFRLESRNRTFVI